MRQSGKILAAALDLVCQKAKPGISTLELDQIAEDYILSQGAKPAFKGYQGFPRTICSAIDEIVVHGIPNANQILHEGDLFTVDCGVTFQGFITDAARSIGIGQVSNEKTRLLETAHAALEAGIQAAQPGNRVSDISKAIEKIVKQAGFKVIHDLTGHGIGRKLHEAPVVNNYFDGKIGPELKPGMTIAIEPIFAVSTNSIMTLSDNWTIVTANGSNSVQEEETILITPNGPEILTKKSIA